MPSCIGNRQQIRYRRENIGHHTIPSCHWRGRHVHHIVWLQLKLGTHHMGTGIRQIQLINAAADAQLLFLPADDPRSMLVTVARRIRNLAGPYMNVSGFNDAVKCYSSASVGAIGS